MNKSPGIPLPAVTLTAEHMRMSAQELRQVHASLIHEFFLTHPDLEEDDGIKFLFSLAPGMGVFVPERYRHVAHDIAYIYEISSRIEDLSPPPEKL